MPMCQAYGCSNKPSKSLKKSFFAIPDPKKEPERCKAWLHAVGTDKFSFATYGYKMNRVVCEDHFAPGCFKRDLQAELGLRLPKRKLIPGAVPSIFAHKKVPSLRQHSTRRSGTAEKFRVLQDLLCPNDASGESSEWEPLHPMEDHLIPHVCEVVEVSTQPLGSELARPIKRRKKREDAVDHPVISSDISTLSDGDVDCGKDEDHRAGSCSSLAEDSDLSESSYKPSSNEGCESPEEEATPEQKCVYGLKYLVFEESLDILLYKMTCSQCFSKVKDIEKYDGMGTFVRVKLYCPNGHIVLTWESQPLIESAPAGNVLVSAALLFSGNTFTRVSQFCQFLGLIFTSHTTYYKFQKNLLIPVISNAYDNQNESLIADLGSEHAMFSGDGRCDSPGYNAKYCTYSMMDIKTDKIIVSEVVQVTEATSSVAMEKLGFQRCLDKLEEGGVGIYMIATERHIGIRALLKKDFSHIDHQFDVWHLSETIKKKLLAKSKTKQCERLAQWIQAISNHLWWSAHSCGGDSELLVEKFSSVVYHVANIHSWDTCSKFHRCEHPPLRTDSELQPAWLELDSPAHNALKDVVMNRRLLADIHFLNRSCHTGSLEVFHGA